MVTIIMVVLFGSVFTSCNNDDDLLLAGDSQTGLVSSLAQDSTDIFSGSTRSFSEYGLIRYPKGTVMFEDFQNQCSIYDDTKVKEAIHNKEIGSSPQNAVVPIIFDENNKLVTPHEFNSKYKVLLQGNRPTVTVFYISLSDFYRVTLLKEATADYSGCIEGIWTFDPYVKFYTTRVEKASFVREKKSETKAITSVQDYFKKANIFYGEFGWISTYTGHVAGIASNLNASYTTIGAALSNLYVVEAIPSASGNWLPLIDGVVEHHANDTSTNGEWNCSYVNNRQVFYPNSTLTLTTANRNAIAAYMENQIGKTYLYPIDKYSTTYYYCSKLVWQAYYNVKGVDIDYDGGYTVYPFDILADSHFYRIQFWLR